MSEVNLAALVEEIRTEARDMTEGGEDASVIRGWANTIAAHLRKATPPAAPAIPAMHERDAPGMWKRHSLAYAAGFNACRALAAAPKASEADLGDYQHPLETMPKPQADPAPPVAFRNLPDGASFEDYREQLAVGNLTAVDQMAFDNRLHDREQRAEAMAGLLRRCVANREGLAYEAGLLAEIDALLGPAAQEGAG